MASRVTVRDTGHKKLLERLQASGRARVTVGIHEQEGSELHEGSDDLTVSDVGAIHEFGLGVPQRSFLRSTMDENRDKYNDALRRIGRLVVQGRLRSTEQGLAQLGARCVGDVQAKIRAGVPPALSPVTVAAKGSSTPLIDTGQMWSSITSRVEQ